MPASSPYIGRFAPSPTGPLHFGSLVAALASYLDARAHNGKWRVRMEDIDTPRCVKGADSHILHQLETHGFEWDDEVVYQSHRHALYREIIADIKSQGLAYNCTCSRRMIKESGGVYAGTCRYANHPDGKTAIRVQLTHPVTQFYDRVLGKVTIDDPHALEDTVLKRRDGLFSYNLVVVADDIEQNITHIVRGSDLLATTATHLSLYQILKQPPPRYAHIPVAAVTLGRKLSKQNHAAPIIDDNAVHNLCSALAFLGFDAVTHDETSSPSSVLQWAINQWQCENVPKKREIIVAAQESTYYTQPRT
ncbi:tRNA glutamyl-Q(34) synthetase GluQRS [Alteromonas sp. C1M14]|uniref:tRNA glutamyl-Q(34) synthetase GluQRS n=1 Tax=Alteromonas sp. C1M14 TaxID=2841567 RepID=UPI001C09611A|nr:tRNA glutamyl-Q(34) synthetase GluQRS [Alteromonas sp. C1M14]MBU2977319.1 tRNA glutamyl-Q(34) synthetase GluQRS [Alteromonas sp. C1M14]